MVWNGIGTYVLCTPEERTYWCGRIRKHWVQMASEDPGVMAAISAACCRHLDMVSGTNAYRHLALEYYARVMASVREDLSAEKSQPRDTTIIKTICLATEAVSALIHNLPPWSCFLVSGVAISTVVPNFDTDFLSYFSLSLDCRR